MSLSQERAGAVHMAISADMRLAVCDQRACLSTRHRHGDWLCWIQIGGSISSM